MGGSRGVLRALTVACIAGAAAQALPALAMPAAGPSLQVGSLTSQPIGHYELCQRLPDECAIRPVDHGPMALDRAAWAKLETVNRAINKAVKPVSDLDVYGEQEFWAYPVNGVGDCEDYVLEKRRQLARAGLSLSNLLITVVRKPDGEGHAVLTVRTTRGDFVLDNLSAEIRSWDETGYAFLKRQASNHTGRWVTLHGESQVVVGAVR